MCAGGGGALGRPAGEGAEAAGASRRGPSLPQPDPGEPLPGPGRGLPQQLWLRADQRDGPDLEPDRSARRE